MYLPPAYIPVLPIVRAVTIARAGDLSLKVAIIIVTLTLSFIKHYTPEASKIISNTEFHLQL